MSIDTAAVRELAARVVTPQDKALPPSCWGLAVREVAASGLRLSQLPTPLLTLDSGRLAANVEAFARWTADRGMLLAPHGKTTMAPELWARQLDAGAWGITVANQAQLAVARSFGVRRVMVANLLLSGVALRWLAEELQHHPDVEVTSWVDSVAAVRTMEEALTARDGAGARRPLDVLVELGAAGGRTGARGLAAAREVAEAVSASPHLRLAGVAGYEGALAHDTDAGSLAVVAAYVAELVALHRSLTYPAGVRPVVTAGGSAFPDVVADGLAELVGGEVDLVLRSGAYLTHDDGFYRHVSPFGEAPRGDGPRLTSAMHGWVRVSSRPEPGLALVDAGKRDLPFDEGLPEPQLRRPRPGEERPTPVDATVSALNDQHGFLRLDPGSDLAVGDELRLGLSHPCTAFDKWGLVPVVDDADAADPVVVDLVRTFF